jgi:hypothetical protein
VTLCLYKYIDTGFFGAYIFIVIYPDSSVNLIMYMQDNFDKSRHMRDMTICSVLGSLWDATEACNVLSTAV